MQKTLHETCKQYVTRRISEGWIIVHQKGHHLILSPPDGGFLRSVDLRNDIETLRPNAAGDENTITLQNPADAFPATDHWNKVDEVVADENSTYVMENDGTGRDLYNLPASSGVGVINFIKIHFRCRTGVNFAFVKPAFKSNGTVTEGTQEELAGSAYVSYSEQWALNPHDSEAWAWADIDALQIGIVLMEGMDPAYCTQVYVEVDYNPIDVPTVTTQDATGIGKGIPP